MKSLMTICSFLIDCSCGQVLSQPVPFFPLFGEKLVLKKQKGAARCLNHTRWLKKRHKKQVIWIYDLAHMLSAGASAVMENGSYFNESRNFVLRCHREEGCKITAHYTKVTHEPPCARPCHCKTALNHAQRGSSPTCRFFLKNLQNILLGEKCKQ